MVAILENVMLSTLLVVFAFVNRIEISWCYYTQEKGEGLHTT